MAIRSAQRSVSGELSGMNAESVEARGGFVLLGSGIPREFTSGVVPEVRPCYCETGHT